MTEKRLDIAGRECVLLLPDTRTASKLMIINGDETLAELFRRYRIIPPQGAAAMILSGNRLADYTPWPEKALRPDFRDFGGQADEYLNWLDSTFMPALREETGMALDAAHTGLMGQSLGGLLTLYAQTRPAGSLFGTAICVSPSSWYPGFFEYFNAVLPDLPLKRWIFACGKNEGRGHRDIKQNVAAYNAELIRRLAVLHGEENVSAYWDEGTHHQMLPERCRWAAEKFFED